MIFIPTKYVEIIILRILVFIYGIKHEYFILSAADNIFHLISPWA